MWRTGYDFKYFNLYLLYLLMMIFHTLDSRNQRSSTMRNCFYLIANTSLGQRSIDQYSIRCHQKQSNSSKIGGKVKCSTDWSFPIHSSSLGTSSINLLVLWQRLTKSAMGMKVCSQTWRKRWTSRQCRWSLTTPRWRYQREVQSWWRINGDIGDCDATEN